MYVEQTSEGYNIMSIPAELIAAVMVALENQVSKKPDSDLTKDDKRFLRKLTKLLDEEIRLQV